MNKLFKFLLVIGSLGLIFRGLIYAQAEEYKSKTRHYYIAAEEVKWDYAPSGKNLIMGHDITQEVWGEQTIYDKVRYIEYTDESFIEKVKQAEWLGINGPVIRGVEGDTLKIHFFNKAKKPYSMHPHGLKYDKDNEGAGYAGVMGKGAQVMPGESYTYTWEVHEKAAPTDDEGSSKVWLYHSHVDPVSDIYDGLFGAIIITRAEDANPDATPNDVDKEFVSTYFIFNESEEWMSEEIAEGHLMHAINGYIFGNLQGLEMNQHDKVRWHLIGLGTEVDLHTAHWHGEVVAESDRITDVIELLPASMKSVDMIVENPGTWLYHCHVTDHVAAGMVTTYTIIPNDQ